MPDLKKINAEIADGVVGGYKKIESSVVGAFQNVEDKFVGRFLVHEGETVEDAKARLAAEQAAREEQAKALSDILYDFMRYINEYSSFCIAWWQRSTGNQRWL